VAARSTCTLFSRGGMTSQGLAIHTLEPEELPGLFIQPDGEPKRLGRIHIALAHEVGNMI